MIINAKKTDHGSFNSPSLASVRLNKRSVDCAGAELLGRVPLFVITSAWSNEILVPNLPIR